MYYKNAIFYTKIHPFIEKVTRTLIFVHDTHNVLCTTVWIKKNCIVQSIHEYDLK